MSSISLKYIDYTKRRVASLLAVDTPFSFFNPIVYKEMKIYQVEINIERKVRVFDGEKWSIVDDEDLLYKIITRLLKKEVQKEIEYKEAV